MARVIDGFEGRCGLYAPELETLIRLLPPTGLMLEVGTGDGVSAAVIALRLPAATIVSIDRLVKGEKGPVGNADNWRANAGPNQHLIIGTLPELSGLLRPLFSLILVDGDHSYAHTVRDLEGAMVVVAPGGLIAVHNYKTHPKQIGRAVDEFCESRGFEIIQGEKTMVVLRKREDA